MSRDMSCYRAESAGRPDETRGLDDGVDAAVQLHLSIHAAHRSLLGSDDRHLHLPIVDQCVEDGLDVIHGQVHLQAHTCQSLWAGQLTGSV